VRGRRRKRKKKTEKEIARREKRRTENKRVTRIWSGVKEPSETITKLNKRKIPKKGKKINRANTRKMKTRKRGKEEGRERKTLL